MQGLINKPRSFILARQIMILFKYIYKYIYKYPPPHFARRREWELNTKHPSPGPCTCPCPSPFAQFQWCLVCFRGSDNPRLGMAARWAPPKKIPKSIKNRFFPGMGFGPGFSLCWRPFGPSPDPAQTARWRIFYREI